MKYILFLLLVGCATTPPPVLQKYNSDPAPQYQVGDCLMVFDPTDNKPTRHRVRVERVDTGLKRYFYRWLMDSGKWDSGLSSSVGKFKTLEKITKKVDDCPESVPVAFMKGKSL
jgi:hypothetical protein